MNINDVSYVGIFIDHIQGTLSKDIPNQHITLAYRPDEKTFDELLKYLGEECDIKIIGYDNDGKNEGLSVSISDNIPYYGAKKKHITLSISERSAPVKTGFLQFDKIIPTNISNQLPEVLTGKIAVFTSKKELIYDADLFNCSIADSVLNNDNVEWNITDDKDDNQKSKNNLNKNIEGKELCR